LLINYFSPSEEEEPSAQVSEEPTILLRTFEGSKGLSGGHVFIVGANDGSIPKIVNNEIKDIEYCKFIVALTRTRKQCHIISNKWFYSPKDKHGKWIEKFNKSKFIDFIPSKFIEDQGYKKSKEIE
jgi:superfamily I DNA/RNA helicase